jgi:hypothetical protein
MDHKPSEITQLIQREITQLKNMEMPYSADDVYWYHDTMSNPGSRLFRTSE